MFVSIIIFIAGLIFGSFLNVVIYRMSELNTIFLTRSHCVHCKKLIKWYDLIPLISFILLKTKCRNCSGKISWQYPLVEFFSATSFLLVYLMFGLTVSGYFLLFISCLLIIVFVYDLKHLIIPDEIVWPGIIISLIFYVVYSIVKSDYHIIMDSLTGGLLGASFIGLLVLATRGKGMGIGDIKLCLLLGLVLGYPLVIVCLFFAFVIGSFVGICLIILKSKTLKDEIAFGPYLIIGFYISLFYGPNVINWYLNLI